MSNTDTTTSILSSTTKFETKLECVIDGFGEYGIEAPSNLPNILHKVAEKALCCDSVPPGEALFMVQVPGDDINAIGDHCVMFVRKYSDGTKASYAFDYTIREHSVAVDKEEQEQRFLNAFHLAFARFGTYLQSLIGLVSKDLELRENMSFREHLCDVDSTFRKMIGAHDDHCDCLMSLNGAQYVLSRFWDNGDDSEEDFCLAKQAVNVAVALAPEWIKKEVEEN